MTALYILAAIGTVSLVVSLPLIIVCIGYSIYQLIRRIREHKEHPAVLPDKADEAMPQLSS